jgi:putative PIN family toxin of toxin-antitoxin system
LKRVVIDANVLLSAFVGHPGAPSAILLEGVRNGNVEAVTCPALIAEVRKNLSKPYFRARLPEPDAGEAIEAYTDLAVMLNDPEQITAVLRDPEDDYLVALARIVEADLIVTGDDDLLEHIGLKPPAINPRNACELLGLIELS